MRVNRWGWLLPSLALFVAAGPALGQSTGDRAAGDRAVGELEELREDLEGLRAEPVPEAGIRAGFDFESDDFSIGAHGYFPLGSGPVRIMPSADVYFGDETSWQLNADLGVSLLRLRTGLGVALVDGPRADGSTEIAYNLFLGYQRPGLKDLRVRPFVEARWTILDHTTRFQIIAGFNIVGPRGVGPR